MSRKSVFSVLSFCIIAVFSVGGTSSCASKDRVTLPSAPIGPGDSKVDLGNSETAPGAQSFKEREIAGKAFSVDGAIVQARAIITNGESRRPLFLDATTIAFATRRASVERWQVFAADLAKKVERRVSFDAGDAEPVAVLGQRLVIASSSDERKSGERVLGRYQEIFIPKDSEQTKPPLDSSMQHLMLEHPALGRRGTEWNRISLVPAQQWTFSVDKDLKQALVLANTDEASQVLKVTIAGRPGDPSIRQWSPIQVEMPGGISGRITDARVFPNGQRAVWSNGSKLWTTTLKGADPVRIGDDSTPGAVSMTVDPSGQWIVFSSPSTSKGLGLMAVHHTGRCLKTLTELPGDETEPSFSPDGQLILFIHKQGDSSAVAQISFGTPTSIAAACP